MHKYFTPCGLFCTALLQLVLTGCNDAPKSSEINPKESQTQIAKQQHLAQQQPQAVQQQTQTPQPQQPPIATKKSPSEKAPVVTYALFKKTVTPAVFELPSGALAIWRKFSGHKPTLLLFSTHPFLTPLPDGNHRALRELLKNGSGEEIVRRGQVQASDTAFTSPQTVSAAIEAGFIGELIFVQPTKRTLADFSLQDFQQRAYNAGFLSPEEARALTMKSGVISGKVRGIPFRVAHPDALPKIDRPVIVHIDLGYFKDLYVNEIKTPIYALLGETATDIGNAGYPAVAVTLSYSNKEADFSLDSRFMISNLADLLYDPTLLLPDHTPPNWVLRSQALTAEAMFSESTANELIAKAMELAPKDPDALYAQSQQMFELQQPAEAFLLLDQAVAIDKGYALAYLELAETGAKVGQLGKANELLEKAAKYFPEDPFIRIRQADLLIQHGRGKEALPLLASLQNLTWSESYHPGIITLLKEMIVTAEQLPPSHP